MKTLITFLLFCGILPVMAQQPIEVKIEERPSSVGVNTAFEMVVPQATASDAIDLWKETILPRKLLSKTPKMEKVKDEWWVNNLLISDITSMPLNVITQVSSFPGHIYVRIFLQSEGGFLGSPGSSEQTNKAATQYIRNFGVELYRQAVSKELRTEERTLQVLENDLKNLTRKNESYGDKIEDAKQEQATLADDADYQRTLLGENPGNPLGVIGETPRDEVESELKSTEKDLKKAEKAESKFSRKVSKNEKAQKDKALEIENQKIKIAQVKNKLDNIR